MIKKVLWINLLVAVGLVFLGSTAMAQSAGSGLQLSIHGFVEMDVIHDNTTLGVISKAGAVPEYNTEPGQLLFVPENTRIDFTALDTIDGWKTKGYLESDFFGPNNGLRIRHAFLSASKDGWLFLAGQWWTLFGWNMDYIPPTVSEEPIPGMLYDRTPQVRVMNTQDLNGAKLQIAVAANDPEQAMSQIPDFNAGVRLIIDGWKGIYNPGTSPANPHPLSVGISGTFRSYGYDALTGINVNPTKTLQASGIAVDTLIPIIPANPGSCSLVFTGEYTTGKGYGADALSEDMVPATTSLDGSLSSGVAGLINGTLTLLNVESWNGVLQFHFPKQMGTELEAGYGAVYSNNAAEITGAVFNKDYVAWANIMQNLNAHMRLGLEFLHYQTHYVNNTNPTDDRQQLTFWYYF